MKVSVVYNICGLGRPDVENIDWYIHCIKSILEQDFDSFRVLISSCCSSNEVKGRLIQEFKDNISYNFIEDIVPVNISFAHSVIKFSRQVDSACAYCYVDSGVTFHPYKTVLKDMWDMFTSDNFSMIAQSCNNDMAFIEHFQVNDLPEKFIFPVGKACNLHCQFFGYQLLEEYGQPFNTVNRDYCSESLFSFLAAAIKTKYGLLNKYKLHHNKSIDGASAAFPITHPWKRTFGVPWDMSDVISQPEVDEIGFGYEEVNNVKIHNPNCFDENRYCTNNRLKEFLKKWCFVPQELINNIKHVFIP